MVPFEELECRLVPKVLIGQILLALVEELEGNMVPKVLVGQIVMVNEANQATYQLSYQYFLNSTPDEQLEYSLQLVSTQHEIVQPASIARKVKLVLEDKMVKTMVFFLAYQVGQIFKAVFYVELMVADPCGFGMEVLCKELVRLEVLWMSGEMVMLTLATWKVKQSLVRQVTRFEMVVGEQSLKVMKLKS